jgi:A/G-specific adenine glycosylase
VKRTQTDEKFIKGIYSFYEKHGRGNLPWRKTTDPYKIWLSEIMLQQTQVDRVVPKYEAFLKVFPTVTKLAKATNSEVLGLWSGLGYNRRALLGLRTAQAVVDTHKGVFPRTMAGLDALPGIGPYIAGAIMAFAYNQPEVLIETNIRTVYIHFYFPKKKVVDDAEILPIIERTLDTKNPREWYWALMDYGSDLKKKIPNPSRKSKHHTVQTTFKGSVREIRGDILRTLLSKKKATAKSLQKNFDTEKFERAIQGLLKEKIIQKKGKKFILQ